MKFNLGCQLSYSIKQFSTFVFNISVVDNNRQKIWYEKLQIEPQLEIDEYTDPVFKNRYFRLNVLPGKLQVNYQATAEVQPIYTDPSTITEVPPAKLPLETLSYLFPSRYCQSDRLAQFATSEFGKLEPGYSRVNGICNWIYDNITYLSGSTNQSTSAADTVVERAGVCRDFAHLGIALCRALNVPARFVAGYAFDLNPPDFHAYFEAYLGDRWYIFDPTRLVPQSGLVRIGTGRDAADAAFATIFGSVQMEQMHLFVEQVQSDDETTKSPAYTVQAIATI